MIGASVGTSLEGWAAVARRISDRAGIRATANSALRWSQRRMDPLPVRRWGHGRRPRVVADVTALEEWCDRQWHHASGGRSSIQTGRA